LRNQVDGYPLSEAGQKRWIADFLSFCYKHGYIQGAFYWSPEWYTEEIWRAFALFRETGDAKEGFKAFHSVFPEDDLPLRRRERD